MRIRRIITVEVDVVPIRNNIIVLQFEVNYALDGQRFFMRFILLFDCFDKELMCRMIEHVTF